MHFVDTGNIVEYVTKSVAGKNQLTNEDIENLSNKQILEIIARSLAETMKEAQRNI